MNREPEEQENAPAATEPQAAPDPGALRAPFDDLDQKVAESLKYGLPAATVVLAGVAGFVQGPSAAILALAGGALVSVIAIFWASVRTLVGETPLTGADAYALAAPRAEEEQKRAVLRALKDLEFERSVGKISDEDYQALVAKYRAEAKRLLKLLDEEAEPRRAQVETLVAKRLRREGILDAGYREAVNEEGAAEGEATAKPAKSKKRKKAAKAAAEPRVCGSCGTMNDADAVFCKKCGARRAATASEEESS